MTRKSFVMMLLLTAALTAGAAVSAKVAEWAKGPVQFLMTKDEQARWQAIDNDSDAEAFITAFWARRDPTPGTPANEFQAEFDARVQYADEKFSVGRRKGSVTDRGRIRVLFGAPTKIMLSDPGPQVGQSAGAPSTDTALGSAAAETERRETWIYEGAKATSLGLPRVQIIFIDQRRSGDYTMVRGGFDLKTAQDRVNKESIKQPNPSATPAPAIAAPATAPPTTIAPVEPVMTEFKTAELKSAVDAFKTAKANPYKGKELHITWGEFVTSSGEYFVPVSLYAPKASGFTADQKLTFFGIVEDAEGKPVAVFEEPATLSASKDDLFFDKSLTLPAGTFKATFGLAEGGKPLSMVSTPMTLSGTLDKDAPATSKLILSSNVYPMTQAQQPKDPFSFGGLKIVPKADKIFKTTEEMWYFVELRNPGLDEANAPRVQETLRIEGTTADGKKVVREAPPQPSAVIELKGVPGHYGAGSAIPLATFKPGKYTMKVKLTDTVRKQTYNVEESFQVVAP